VRKRNPNRSGKTALCEGVALAKNSCSLAPIAQSHFLSLNCRGLLLPRSSHQPNVQCELSLRVSAKRDQNATPQYQHCQVPRALVGHWPGTAGGSVRRRRSAAASLKVYPQCAGQLVARKNTPPLKNIVGVGTRK
jgi:hypothetical protein